MLNSPMTSFFSFGERASISKFRIFLAAFAISTFCNDKLHAQSTDTKPQGLSTEFLTYLTAADVTCSGNNPFEDAGKISSTRDASGNVQTTYGEKSACANAYMPTFCAASKRLVDSNNIELNKTLKLLKPSGLQISSFKKCVDSELKTVEKLCDAIKTKAQCESLKATGQENICPSSASMSRDDLDSMLADAKDGLKSTREQISENEKKVTELKNTNIELTQKMQSLPQTTQNILKSLETKFEAEKAKLDAEAAKQVDAYENEIEKVNSDNIKLVTSLKETELQAVEQVNASLAACRATASQKTEAIFGKPGGAQKNPRTSGVGGLLGATKKMRANIKAMAKALEKECLESDTYLEAIKMIQSKKQAALDSLKENQKLLNNRIDRVQKLILQTQNQNNQAKDLLLKTKNNEIEKAQIEMNQALQGMQAQLTQNDAEIKRIEESLSEIKDSLEENQRAVYVAQCKIDCIGSSSNSGEESNYGKAVALLDASANVCSNIELAVRSATDLFMSDVAISDAWNTNLKLCNIAQKSCSPYSPGSPAPVVDSKGTLMGTKK